MKKGNNSVTLFNRGGTGMRLFELRRARALHFRARVGLEPGPDFEVQTWASSGFAFSSSGGLGPRHNYEFNLWISSFES